MSNDLRHFRIGPWQVDCQLGTLISDQSRQRLPPKLIGLLQQLAQSPGQLVSREQLLATVWDGAIVNEEAVSRAVAELRQALGDNARQPTYIETIPKRGYRLIQPVEPVDKVVRSLNKSILTGFGILLLVALIFAWFEWRWQTESTPAWPEEGLAKPITSDEGWEGQPAISNDGQLIVFAQPSASGRPDLWLVDTTTLVRRQLTDDSYVETSPIFSPDASQVAYRQLIQGKCSILIYTLLEGKTRRVADCHPNLQGLDWSHDASELLFLSSAEQGGAISRLRIADGSIAIVATNDIQGASDQLPKFSPNGKWVSFTRGTRTRRELYRVATAGGELQKLTNDGQYVTGHAWLGEDIVFSSDRFGSRQLWYLSSENLAISSLGFPGVRLLSTSYDGTKVAFESAHFTANIYRLTPNETESIPQKIISSSAYDNYPSLSPSGDLLAYVSNRSGLVSLWMADADTWQARMLLQQPRSRITDPAWSADGTRLLATRYTEGTSEILEFSLETRQVKVLNEIGKNVYGARFSGSWIYFIHHGAQDPVLARFPANGRGSVELTAVVANRAIPGEDGLIYFTRPAHDGIFEFDPSSGSEKVVVPDLPAESWQSWAVNASWLVYVRQVTNGGQVVMRRNLKANDSEVVTTFAPDTVGGAIEISSDGITLFVARTDRADLDIKMIDLAK